MMLAITLATSLTIFKGANPLNRIRDHLVSLNADSSAAFFELKKFDRLLKTTISLCPECLAHEPAIVYERDGRVLMTTRCPDHGITHALLESDASFYYLSNKD